MSLRDFLLSLASGGIVLGPMLFALFETELNAVIPPKWRRLAVAVATGLIGLGAVALAYLFGYLDAPAERPLVWYAELAWQHGILLGASAFVGSQMAHDVFVRSRKGGRP